MLKKSLPVSFFIITIVLCSAAEIILLEVKYQLFTGGGFLQAHELESGGQMAAFALVFLALNIFLYGSVFLFWRFCLVKLRVKNNIIAFHFMMIAGIVTAISLVVSFQLHKYFADAMNLTLIKDIAGGDIKTALLYVMNEALLFIIGILVLCAIYFVIYKIMKPFLVKYENAYMSKVGNRISRIKNYVIALSAIIATILLVNENENLRYNLNRSNSYFVLSSTLDTLSDIDRDGYGSFRFPQDNNFINASIYPGALDIPDNGIDENGLFGDFTNFSPDVNIKINPDTGQKPKHIVVIILESTRGDIIGKKINGQLVAPNLMKLAEEGRAVEEAYSHTGYTGSSLATFFSGKLGKFSKDLSIYPLLKKHGYRLALFSGQDESWSNLDKRLGTRVYADYFYDAQAGADKRVFPSRLPSSIKLSAATLWHEFKQYSDALDWSRPQYIYFNMQEGHFPYYHREMTKNFIKTAIPRSQINVENKDWLRKTYWNGMNYADQYIGKIIAELKDKGMWENTLFIVSGDHGEELFENNHLGHGFFLSDIQTHIPLILNDPNFQMTQPVGHSDIKNIIISNALNHSDKMQNVWLEKRKSVFQYIGTLNNPAKISFRYPSKKQIILDMRNMLVRPIGQDNWITFASAINKQNVKLELEKLVYYWENLRWQSHLAESN